MFDCMNDEEWRIYDEWEDKIAVPRTHRRLLLVREIPRDASRAQLEAGVRAKLTKPDSATFLWPPARKAVEEAPHHRGWVLISFEDQPDIKLAEEELQNWVFESVQIEVKRPDQYETRSTNTRSRNTAVPASLLNGLTTSATGATPSATSAIGFWPGTAYFDSDQESRPASDQGSIIYFDDDDD